MSTTDLEQRYAETIAAMATNGLIDAGELSSLEDLMQAIKDTVAEEELSFDDFEQFYAWWDVTTAYDQLDSEVCAERHKPALAIAYEALVQEGFFYGPTPFANLGIDVESIPSRKSFWSSTMIAQSNQSVIEEDSLNIVTFSTNLGRRSEANPRRIAYIVRGVERRSTLWEFDVAFADAIREKAGVLTITLSAESSITPKEVLREYELGFYDNLHNEPLRAALMAATAA